MSEPRPDTARFITVAAAAIAAGLALDAIVFALYPDHRRGVAVGLAVLLAVGLVVSWFGYDPIGSLLGRLKRDEAERVDGAARLKYLEVHNSLLRTIASSIDIARAFLTFAKRIAELVPCDRVGLALLKEGDQQLETFTARVGEEERRTKPRPDVEFPVRGTLIGAVITSSEPRVVADVTVLAGDFPDANVLTSAGFRSSVIVPLIVEGRAVGTLSLVARRREAFTTFSVHALTPIADILAAAFVTKRLESALERSRRAKALADLTFSVSSEINSALETIVGQCELLEKVHPDEAVQRQLATILTESRRVSEILRQLQTVADQNLRAADASVETMGTGGRSERDNVERRT